jgi:hypothetical protein
MTVLLILAKIDKTMAHCFNRMRVVPDRRAPKGLRVTGKTGTRRPREKDDLPLQLALGTKTEVNF